MLLTRRNRLVRVQTRTSVANLTRTVDVAADGSGDYTTLDSAIDAVTLLAPDADDPVSIRLAADTYTVADETQLVLPANCGIYATDPRPAQTIITRAAMSAIGVPSGLIRVAPGCVFEGFTIYSSTGGGGAAAFSSAAGTAGDITFRRLVVAANGEDSFYLYGGGNYLIEDCDVGVNFDGIAVFGTDASQRVKVKNSYLHTVLEYATFKNLIRVDNANAVVRVLGSKLLAQTSAALGGAHCIGSGLSGTSSVAFGLEVIGSQLSAVSSGAGASSGCIAKRGGTMSIRNSSLAITADRVGTDYCLDIGSCSDYETGYGLSGVTIAAANATLAQTQNDAGGNTLTGFSVI